MATGKQMPVTLSALCISTFLFLLCWHMSMFFAEEYTLSEPSEVNTGRYWRGQTHVSSPAIAVLKTEAEITAKASAGVSQFPRKIWQLWKNGPADHLAATTELSGVWREVNHGYRYERFTRDTGISYAQSALQPIVRDDEEQYEIIQKLECMDEHDQLFEEFLKYLVLAVEGGVWADVDAVPLTPVSSWAHPKSGTQDDDVSHLNLVVGMDATSKSSIRFSPTAVLAKPNHPVILEILMSIVHEVQESVCPTRHIPTTVSYQDDVESPSIELAKRWILPRRSIYQYEDDEQTSNDEQEQGQHFTGPIRLKHVRPGHPLYDVSAGTYLETDEENSASNTDNHDDPSPYPATSSPRPQVTAAPYSPPRPSAQKPLSDTTIATEETSTTTPITSISQDRLTQALLSHLFRHHDLTFEADNLAQLCQTRDPVRIGDVLILPWGTGFDKLSFDAQDSLPSPSSSFSIAVDAASTEAGDEEEEEQEVSSTSIVFHPKPLLVLAGDEEE